MSEAESESNTPRKPTRRARNVFAGALDRFIEVQRDRPLRAWLLENREPRHRLRLPGGETQRHLIDDFWWQRGLVVDCNGRLEVLRLPEVGPHLPMDDNWVAVRDYIEALLRDGFYLEVWLDADECRARGLLPGQAATDASSDGTTAPLPEPEPTSVEPQDGGAPKVSPEDGVPPMPPKAPNAQSLQKGYREEDNDIARKLLTDLGCLDNPANHKLNFWRLAGEGARQLSGFGRHETKTARLRRAIKRVTGF